MNSVPYRSAGTARTMALQALHSVGTRAAGRTPVLRVYDRPPLGRLACDCAPATVSYEHSKRMPLGSLGASPLLETAGQTGIKVGATAGASAIAAAAGAGAAAGPIGAVVGAVVGLLSTKLFGHANYAQIANDVASQLKYAEAYKQVAGQYAGRAYGSDELKQVWYGMVHEQMFPKNASPGTCNVQACIAGQRARDGSCPNCGGTQAWAVDLFIPGKMANPVQGFPGAIAAARQQGIQNPVQIADQIILPAWAPPDAGKFNIKWASPQNSRNPAIVRQLFIDTLDALLFEANGVYPLYYGTLPGSTAPVAPPPRPAAVAPAPPSVSAPMVTAPVQPAVVPAPPVVASPPGPAVAVINQPVSPILPAGFTQVGADASGNPVFADPQGVLYTWAGGRMQIFTGTLAGGSSLAAQLQTAIQQALAQGQNATQASQAALAQAQAQGIQATPALQAQVAQQAAVTADAPAVATPATAGPSGAGLPGWTVALGILGLIFATARPARHA